MQSIGNNAKYFTHLIGNQVRFTIPPYYPSLTEVSEDQQARLRSIIEKNDEGHVRGVGRVLKGTSPSLDSTAASKAPKETSHQFSGDYQNDNLRFPMYEAQLRRMQRKIKLLKNSILGIVPEQDEDDHKGLGDM
ncbi:hypothetical protein Adt_39949 [Abeliophyllum distichum]|uniref:Uncharacterized protein n=1 Tax=Abeliophyllum distichum TaxID=126358 RepID=A0ABD1Q6J5_9LAMI